MTPSEVRQQLGTALLDLKNSIISYVQKRDLVLFNGFQDIAASGVVEINLLEKIPSEDTQKYNVLLSRVNVLIRDDSASSPTYNGFMNVTNEVEYAIMPNGRLRIRNRQTESIRLSIYVSAKRA